MTEYWLVYDPTTGAELYRGSGSPGTAAAQILPEGAALVLVPQAVVASPELNLSALRAALTYGIDTEAEATRLHYLTPGMGQALTYQRKEAEARAFVADNGAATPFLAAEANARGVPIAIVAGEVVATADAWVAIGSAIEGKRMAAKAALADAQTFGEIVAAAAVDWSMPAP